MIEGKNVFPVFDSIRAGTDYQCLDAGIDLRTYAAIHLKIPRSGDPEIDAMIRESVRRDFAEKAVAAMPVMLAAENEGVTVLPKGVADVVFELADAMLAEWEKEVEE
jgi:hypothetical protein